MISYYFGYISSSLRSISLKNPVTTDETICGRRASVAEVWLIEAASVRFLQIDKVGAPLYPSRAFLRRELFPDSLHAAELDDAVGRKYSFSNLPRVIAASRVRVPFVPYPRF